MSGPTQGMPDWTGHVRDSADWLIRRPSAWLSWLTVVLAVLLWITVAAFGDFRDVAALTWVWIGAATAVTLLAARVVLRGLKTG